MKSFYACLFSFFSLLVTSLAVQANTVIVKGYVTTTAGVAIANKAVRIMPDSSTTVASCFQYHVKYTNASGFYADTLSCSSNITRLRISVENCNGTVIVHDPQVPPGNVVESNFVVCVPPPPACHSNFSFSRTSANYKVVKFNSSIASAAPSDNIISRKWRFGDGDTLSGNIIDPQHTYVNDGVYNVCLIIKTANGCESQECKLVEVREPKCFSKFTYNAAPATSAGFQILFNSTTSTAPPSDSIRERIWKFGDGSVAAGNAINPAHTYTTAGTYNVCLIIRTNGGCSDTSCISILVPLADQVFCRADFSYIPTASSVKFQSNNSATSPSGIIVSRTWQWGDGTSLVGNVVDPTHVYARPGLYNVCLTIKTSNGCENRICKLVTTTDASTNCAAQFTHERIAAKKIRFNSVMSWVAPNDSIVSRSWNFGDGSPVLGGNVSSPVKEYVQLGVYTVCLKIITARGCESRVCNVINLQDSIRTPTTTEAIKIISLYPTPTTVQINTIVWSLHSNVKAELAIYDIYGVKKWSTNKVLLQGNNYSVVPTSFLLAGPYFFRVTTIYGIKSRQFYKL